ncbi:MAG: cytochrome c [Zhengella sp.]|uniref:c-type cytochrome n=1 Tax=Zhengella sp. TaxID=2282762 RepID=UPI001DCB56E6|nr:cytochrome c [Notoacmeibacter sp.]MCC0027568.1 cytochrome c [Brucellaceae bacterium]
MRGVIATFAALVILAPGTIAAMAQEADVEHGKALVETNCAQCHGVGASDASKHPAAPPFRELSERYPVDALEEAFAEGIVTGHEDMPEFEATPQQITDIIAYLSSIQPE